jgi:hypothetical protein
VLDAVLDLLKAPAGPVIKDFPENEPENNEIIVLSCPVRYDNKNEEKTDADPLLASFHWELTALRPWYDIAVNKRKRTTVGVSGMKMEDIPEYIYAFAKGDVPKSPRQEYAPAYILKLAVEDLKSYYIEAVTAQPGQAGVSALALQDWFWDETEAGKVLLQVKKASESSADKMLNVIASHFLVPGDVARRQKK